MNVNFSIFIVKYILQNMSLFNFDDLLNDPFPIFPEPLPTPVEDVVYLSQRLDQLSIEINTTHIKLELETLKRRRLHKSLKQANNEILALKNELIQRNQDNIALNEHLALMSQTIFSEIACLTQRTYICLGRMHHISAVPHIPMTEADHYDLAQQAMELLSALHLIRVVSHPEF